MRFRIETDALGSKEVPIEAYYGIQTLRAKENFEVTKEKIHKQLIRGLAIVKKSSAQANKEAGLLDDELASAIILACDDIINGKLHGQFITTVFQGGAGTSINMNANEVIANRAEEILGGKKGEYKLVHPLDNVNCGQSTNDVVPTASKIAVIVLTKKLIVELKKLHKVYEEKANEFVGTIKMGRTHLQDAVPMSLGQEFSAFASALGRDIKRITAAMKDLREINMGATAIGTGLNANEIYLNNITNFVAKNSRIKFTRAVNLVDSTRNLDSFLWLSSSFKTLAVNLSKTANDLRLMSSSSGFGEINLPHLLIGSSSTPGKVTPVIPELVNQVAFQIMGYDLTITKAVEAGQLELNVFEPIIIVNLFQQLDYLRRAVRTFRKKAVEGITVNEEKMVKTIEDSLSMVTALIPHVGYERSALIAKEASATKKTIREVVVENNILTERELDIILDIKRMTQPGIVGETLIKKK
ncbi:aspartate ammonia-lyase [Mycoplasmatota bacterium WC44]